MRVLLSIILSTLLLPIFFSCEENDDFSSDPNIRLSFSRDTISFDTVFTDIGSSRRTLMVYNPSGSAVVISSAKVMNPDKSGFSIVFDGVSGVDIQNTELLKKDSAYLYVMVKIDPNNANNPILIRDSICFTINGKQQFIQLEAVGQDVHLWRGKSIVNDTTLTGEKPFLVYDSLIVEKSATLNIEKNVKIHFHSGAGIKVYGTIKAMGTVTEPIIFRGDRTDNLFSNVPYDRIPGQWEGMEVDSLSFNNYFEHFHLRNSIKGIWFKPSNLSNSKAIFRNSIIHNTKEDGINAQNCDIKGENSLFSNSGGALVKLIGGKYEFLHCTLANYMSWWGMRPGKALIIGNYTDDERFAPLIKCDFANSIISGSGNSEIKFQEAPEVIPTPFEHLFTNCLIKIGGEDDANFVNTIWKEDAKFKNINKDNDRFYSFELDSLSPAINKADFIKAYQLPLDMNGNSRLSDEGPDIGCYEWISSAETP